MKINNYKFYWFYKKGLVKARNFVLLLTFYLSAIYIIFSNTARFCSENDSMVADFLILHIRLIHFCL